MQDKWKNYPVTTGLIAICTVVYGISTLLFGLQMSAYDARVMGGFNPILVFYNHEYYRVITANFIHFGILHVFLNCYSINNVGFFLERLIGPKNMFFTILVSMITTMMLPSLLFFINGSGFATISGGASGIVFGLVGALLALCLEYKYQFESLRKQLLLNLLLMLFLSISVPSISLWGHVGGLVGGFVFMYFVLQSKKKKKYQKKQEVETIIN